MKVCINDMFVDIFGRLFQNSFHTFHCVTTSVIVVINDSKFDACIVARSVKVQSFGSICQNQAVQVFQCTSMHTIVQQLERGNNPGVAEMLRQDSVSWLTRL